MDSMIYDIILDRLVAEGFCTQLCKAQYSDGAIIVLFDGALNAVLVKNGQVTVYHKGSLWVARAHYFENLRGEWFDPHCAKRIQCAAPTVDIADEVLEVMYATESLMCRLLRFLGVWRFLAYSD